MNNTRQERLVDKNSIISLFKTLNSWALQRVTLVLIGGGAMSLKGDKDATKDVDVVVADSNERQSFRKILLDNGFSVRRPLSIAYQQLDAMVLQDQSGHRIDLFPAMVARRFHVHDKMIERAQPFLELQWLRVLLLSDEDIFLSKSVTERDLDLEDMFILYRKGLDRNIVLAEQEVQTRLSGTLWSTFLNLKLKEMEERFDITVPWQPQLERMAINELEGNKQESVRK